MFSMDAVDQAILRRLQRVDAALVQWQAVEADRALPAESRRHLLAPPLDQQTLLDLRRLLLEDLAGKRDNQAMVAPGEGRIREAAGLRWPLLTTGRHGLPGSHRRAPSARRV